MSSVGITAALSTTALPSLVAVNLVLSKLLIIKYPVASCEVSVSLNIWSDTQWPLWYETEKGEVPMYTKPGEAVFYEGQKYDHWREPFEGESCCQIFMHYIRANGENRDRAYDGMKDIKYPKLIMKPWLK